MNQVDNKQPVGSTIVLCSNALSLELEICCQCWSSRQKKAQSYATQQAGAAACRLRRLGRRRQLGVATWSEARLPQRRLMLLWLLAIPKRRFRSASEYSMMRS